MDDGRLTAVLGTLADGWRSRDLSSTEQLLDEDVVWQGVTDDLLCTNRRQVLDVLRDQLDAGLKGDRIEMLLHGDHVVLGFGWTEDDDGGDPPVVGQIFQVLTFRDGRIVRMEDFERRADAMAAAGAAAMADWA